MFGGTDKCAKMSIKTVKNIDPHSNLDVWMLGWII